MILHRNVLGVDVAGGWIDVFDASNSRSLRILNEDIGSFVRALPAGAFVVFEATGGYERLLMEALETADVAHARVNPRQARDPFVRRDIGRMLSVLRGRRASLEKEIAAHVSAQETLARDHARLRTAPGIGSTIAAIILARLPELGQLDRRAIASLAGLAPHACDSGLRRGRRHVWGGRADVRRALYIAALVASRCNPDLKAVRERMQAAGKPAKVAILALARKLLTILNAMIRDQRNFA
jgi:transposase